MAKGTFRLVVKDTGTYMEGDNLAAIAFTILKKCQSMSWEDFVKEVQILDVKMKAQIKREYTTLHQRERRKRDNGG